MKESKFQCVNKKLNHFFFTKKKIFFLRKSKITISYHMWDAKIYKKITCNKKKLIFYVFLY